MLAGWYSHKGLIILVSRASIDKVSEGGGVDEDILVGSRVGRL